MDSTEPTEPKEGSREYYFAAAQRLASKEQKQEAAKSSEAVEAVAEVIPLAEIIHVPSVSNPDQPLVSVPLLRHWLFVPSGTKLRCRELRSIVMHQGKLIHQVIRIGDFLAEAGNGYGVLTVKHQYALFVLQQLWQQQGGPLVRFGDEKRGVVRASSWMLEQAFFGSHGGRQKRMVRAVLQELSSIPIEINNYIRPDGEINPEFYITGLIAGAEFTRKHKRQDQDRPWVEIYLSSIITQAFAERSVKPLHLPVVRDARSDLMAILYPKVDYYLSSHAETELRLDQLVEKLGLADKLLKKPSYRLHKFAPLVKELDGLPLSLEGYVIDAKLEKTSDNSGHKLVLKRRKES